MPSPARRRRRWTSNLAISPGGADWAPMPGEADGADDPADIPGDDKDGPGVRVRQGGVPPGDGAFDCKRREKADSSTRLDRVDKELGQGPAVGIARRRMQPLDRDVPVSHARQCNAARAAARQVR